MFAQAFAGEFDAVGVVNDAIEDSVSECRIADDVVPAIGRHLAGEKDRAGIIAVLDDFQQIAGLVGGELFGPPIVEDES